MLVSVSLLWWEGEASTGTGALFAGDTFPVKRLVSVLSWRFDLLSLSPPVRVTLRALNRIVLGQEGLTTNDIALRAVSVTLLQHEHMVSLPSV